MAIGKSIPEVVKTINKEVVARRPGDPASVVASSKKAYDILGWKPEYTNIEKIIQTVWDYKVRNRD